MYIVKNKIINKRFYFLLHFLIVTALSFVFFLFFQISVKAQLPAPASYDWRDVHGIDWVSPVRSFPNNNGCFADASTALLETQVNLYYNKILNLDLSEQAARDCFYDTANTIPELTNKYNPDPGCPTDGSESSWFARKTVNVGLFDEACDVFRTGHVLNTCSNSYICNDWQSRVWKATDYMELYTAFSVDWFGYKSGYNEIYGSVTPEQCPNMLAHAEYISDENEFKKELIKNGPMHTIVQDWGHEMLLVGYGTKNDWTLLDNCDNTSHDGYCFSDGCLKLSPTCDASNVGLRYCEGGNVLECIESSGSYFSQGTGLTCVMPSCSSAEIGNRKCINDATYECISDAVLPFWSKVSDCDGMCVNGQCTSSLAIPQSGDKRCVRNGGDQHFAYEEYTPGSKETFWTFKNQNLGGATFGDHGYIDVSVPYEDLVSATYVKGPFIPPTDSTKLPINFDESILCSDLDNDSFCNWGISETKPATCAQGCNVAKDCDDTNPYVRQYDSNMNCNSNIDLNVSANAVNVVGTTYDINLSLENLGGNDAIDVTIEFIKGYDIFVSATGLDCTVNESEFLVTCTIPVLASGSDLNGVIRMTSLLPYSRYDFIARTKNQTDADTSNDSAFVVVTTPEQECEVLFDGNTSTQRCISIDNNNGTFYTSAGDLIRIVCTTPTNPLATGCTYFHQILNVQPGLNIVDVATGGGMIWGQGGTNNLNPVLRILSQNDLSLAELNVEMERNLDWSNLTGGSDNSNYKAFVHNLVGAPGTAESYTLYVPFRNGDTSVGICPNANSLSLVGPNCSGLIIKREADGDTDVVTIDSRKYWKISGLTSTGGFSIAGNTLSATGDEIIVYQIVLISVLIINLLFVTKRISFSKKVSAKYEKNLF